MLITFGIIVVKFANMKKCHLCFKDNISITNHHIYIYTEHITAIYLLSTQTLDDTDVDDICKKITHNSSWHTRQLFEHNEKFPNTIHC